MKYLDSRVHDESFESIKEYCTKRNYKCKGCRYSIDKITKEHQPGTTCIFGNCPCGWEII